MTFTYPLYFLRLLKLRILMHILVLTIKVIILDIRRKRAKLYEHINMIPEHRLTKKLMDCVKNLKATSNWQKNVHEDLIRKNNRHQYSITGTNLGEK